MEIISEAALALAGDHLQVVGLSQIRGYRWLALDQGSIHLGIRAETSSPSSAEQTVEESVEETVVTVKMTQQSDVKTDHLPAASPIVFEGKSTCALSSPLPPLRSTSRLVISKPLAGQTNSSTAQARFTDLGFRA